MKQVNIVKQQDVRTAKVKSIKYIGKEDVYNLEVEDTHNFFANDIVVHNCRYAIEEYTKANTFSFGKGKIL